MPFPQFGLVKPSYINGIVTWFLFLLSIPHPIFRENLLVTLPLSTSLCYHLKVILLDNNLFFRWLPLALQFSPSSYRLLSVCPGCPQIVQAALSLSRLITDCPGCPQFVQADPRLSRLPSVCPG